MTDKLKIYACSGIGDEQTTKTFVSDGTNAGTNTRAVNSLLSQINLFTTQLRFQDTLTTDEIETAYNKLDLYSVCYYYAKLYANDNSKLAQAGLAIAKLVDQNVFSAKSTDKQYHEARVETIIESVEDMLTKGDFEEVETAFIDWWDEEIVNGNIVGLKEDGKIGATITTDYGDLNKYLYDGGTYFLYLYIPESKRAMLPYKIRRKIRKQQEIYNYCKKIFCAEYGGIYGSEEDMKRVIRAGIIEDFKGQTPENVIASILKGESVAAISATVIAAIISAVTSIILTTITLIVQYCSAVAVAKYAVPEDPESGVPVSEDVSLFSSKSSIWWIAGGIAALYIFSKIN